MLLAYVTGQLTQEDRADLEKRLLEDESFSREMEEAEFALLEDYISESLPRDEHELVAAWIAASPWHRQHIAITKALSRREASTSTRRVTPPLLWWAAAAACVALVAVVLLVRYQNATKHSQDLAVNSRLAAAGVSSADASSFKGNTILLRAERRRGAGPATGATYAIRPEDPTRMQILVSEPGEAVGYSLDLRSTTDAQFPPLHVANLHAKTQASVSYVEVILPGMLRPGAYSATLRSPAGAYQISFHVSSSR